MPTLADLQQAWYAQYGYVGSISDMEYQYYSNPPTLDSYGFVRVASPPGNTQSTGTAGFTYYFRVIEGGTFTKARIGINVTSGNMCVAAYKCTGSGILAKPGTQIATTGSIVCPTTATFADIPMGSSVTVSAGDWLSLGVDNAVAAFACANGIGSSLTGTANFASEGVFPAPATANASTNNSRMFSMIGIP